MTLYRNASARRERATTKTAVIALALSSALYACGDGTLAPDTPYARPGFERSSRIHVTNDPVALSRRVRDQELALPIVAAPTPTTASSRAAATRMPEVDHEVVLTLRAEVEAPDLGGTTIQATHVAMDRGMAYVSYNVQGPTYRGGVDVFDVRQPSRPTLVSEALFDETDVSALDESGGSLFLATATGEPGFSSPAVLEEVALEGGRLTAFSRRVDVPSFAATGVVAIADQILVTSGDGGDGGLSILSRRTLDREGIVNFRDARAVAAQGNIAIGMKGTPGGLWVVDRRSTQVMATWEPGGANIPESKSTIKIYRNFVLMSAGDEGLKVVSMRSGRTVADLPAPDVEGIPPEYSVTNAVTALRDLVFLANGGAGLYVARIRVSDIDDDAELEIVGRVEFPDGPSVNFVAAKGNVLFVAAGEGGLKIVEIVRPTPVAEDE